MSETVSEILTGNSVDFVLEHLNVFEHKLLEVGCGNGDLAVVLQDRGARVIAIDLDQKLVEEAAEKGVDARTIDLLEFVGEDFDAIIFSRSLHHIENLEGAVERSRQMLKPNGVLLLEEFGVERIDVPTAEWFYGNLASLSDRNLTNEKWTKDGDPLELWHDEHAHEPPLHTSQDMLAAVNSRFQEVKVLRGPYLFRSVASELKECDESYAELKRIYAEECRLIESEIILANGFRVVAGKSN